MVIYFSEVKVEAEVYTIYLPGLAGQEIAGFRLLCGTGAWAVVP